jgi:YHS domain-containing protein
MIRPQAIRAVFSLLVYSASVAAQEYFADENGVAGGHDVVAYFTRSEAVSGLPEHEHLWRGGTWRFSSKAHLDLFIADPERYAPQFGGAGALTVAHGAKFPGNPTDWYVYNDRLYFFLFPAARETWLMNPDKLVPRAEKHWPALNP